MAAILIKLVLAPGLVAAATLAERAWGPRTAGVLSAFPAIVGPLLLATALEHGAHAAARAAAGTLLGLASLSVFTVAYAESARHRGWRASLAIGWLAAAIAAGAAGAAAGRTGAITCGVIAIASLTGTGAMLKWRSQRHAPGDSGLARTGYGLARRVAATILLVTLLSAAVSRLGAATGGLLAALPIVASTLAVFAHRRSGPAAAVEILRGTITGMAGFVAFCEIVALSIAGRGVTAAFALATAAALLLQLPLARRPRGYPAAENSCGRSGDASARACRSPSASRSAA